MLNGSDVSADANGDSAAAAGALGIYVHLPWCESKCPYCDFNSYALEGGLPVDDYVEALLADISRDHAAIHGREAGSVFIGGGTPSLFPGAAIKRVLDALREHFVFAADVEITLEANPGSVELARLDAYREAGVNRLSIGVQSFDAAALTELGRRHSAAEAVAALGVARAAGFDNVNLDLMFALPGQTTAAAMADIDQLLALAPEHISYYQLTLEPGTLFHRAPPVLPDDELAWDMQEAAVSRFEASGYRRYEISAYAKPGRRCRHNLNYWRFGDYVALGAGAHGKLSDANGWPARYERPRHPRRYQAVRPSLAAALKPVAAVDLPFEFFLNAARLTDGHDLGALPDPGIAGRAILAEGLEAARSRGLLAVEQRHFRPTALGFRFLNDLQTLFLPGRK